MGEEKEFKAEEFKDVLRDYKEEIRSNYIDPPDLLCFVGIDLFYEIQDGFDDLVRTDGGQGVTLSCSVCPFTADSVHFGDSDSTDTTCPQCGGTLIYESSSIDNHTDDNISTDIDGDIWDSEISDVSVGFDSDNFPSLEADRLEGNFVVSEDVHEGEVDELINKASEKVTSLGTESLSIFGIQIIREPSLGDHECVLLPKADGGELLHRYIDVVRSFRFPPRKVDPSSPDVVICAMCDEKTDDPAIVTETEAFCSIGCYL